MDIQVILDLIILNVLEHNPWKIELVKVVIIFQLQPLVNGVISEIGPNVKMDINRDQNNVIVILITILTMIMDIQVILDLINVLEHNPWKIELVKAVIIFQLQPLVNGEILVIGLNVKMDINQDQNNVIVILDPIIIIMDIQVILDLIILNALEHSPWKIELVKAAIIFQLQPLVNGVISEIGPNVKMDINRGQNNVIV
jgi:hypothetical protein